MTLIPSPACTVHRDLLTHRNGRDRNRRDSATSPWTLFVPACIPDECETSPSATPDHTMSEYQPVGLQPVGAYLGNHGQTGGAQALVRVKDPTPMWWDSGSARSSYPAVPGETLALADPTQSTPTGPFTL